jgi:hypothetical protein
LCCVPALDVADVVLFSPVATIGTMEVKTDYDTVQVPVLAIVMRALGIESQNPN